MASNAVRDLRYRVYAGAWGRGDMPPGVQGKYAAAAGIGFYHHAIGMPILLSDEFHRLHEFLDTTHVIAPIETADDAPDVGPSARDKRELEDAQVRLRQLIREGGVTDTGDRWLFDAAADEILRLRGCHDGDDSAIRTMRDELKSVRGELRQAKEALEQARAKVDELRAEVDDYAKRLAAAGGAAAGARLGQRFTREQGAAEMRERAVQTVVELFEEAQRAGAGALPWGVVANALRGLPLDGAPPADPVLTEDERATLERLGYVEKAGTWQHLWVGPAYDPAKPDDLAELRRDMAGHRELDKTELSAEDAETLRASGAWRTSEDGLVWVGPAGGVVDPRTSFGLRGMREAAAELRTKAPPVAHGEPGKVTGGDHATGGTSSLAEEQGAAQGTSPAPGQGTAPHGGDRGQALPKPTRVEVGQRWRHLHDGLDRVVEQLTEESAYLSKAAGRPAMLTSQEGMLESPLWTFLGGPSPQDPSPKRDDEAAARLDERIGDLVVDIGRTARDPARSVRPDAKWGAEVAKAGTESPARGVVEQAEKEHQCGGPREACMEPGCDECGTPAEMRDASDIAREMVEARSEGETFWLGDRKESIVLSHRFSDMSQGVDCVRRIVARFIERGRAEGLRAACRGPAAPPAAVETSEPTARDAVAGMLARGRWEIGEALARGDVSVEEALHRVRAGCVQLVTPSAHDRACIAALEALARGAVEVHIFERRTRFQAIRIALAALDGETLEHAARRVIRERDEAREEVDRWIGRAADLEKQRDEACKDALDAMREARTLRHRVAELETIAASFICGKCGTFPSDGEPEPSGMRIEKRADGEYLVGAPNGGTDADGNGCGADSPGRAFGCTYHFGGEHLATYPSNGAEFVEERWPIAAPVHMVEPASGGTSHPEALTSADGKVTLIIRDGVEARAVLATVAELLDVPLSTATLEQQEAMGIIQRAAMSVRGALADGIREGERRAKVKAAELATSWATHRDRRRAVANAAEDAGRDAEAERHSAAACVWAAAGRDLKDAFGIAPTDPGKPPTGEPAPDASGVVSEGGTTDLAAPDRETLGREVRAAWVAWAHEQPFPKGSWLLPWESLAEPDREVDRRIGERLFNMGHRAGRLSMKAERETARREAEDFARRWEEQGDRLHELEKRATGAPAQGPTLEALRELVCALPKCDAPGCGKPATACYPPHDDETCDVCDTGYRADGLAADLTYAAALLKLVAGIEPPPCPPSPPADPQGTAEQAASPTREELLELVRALDEAATKLEANAKSHTPVSEFRWADGGQARGFAVAANELRGLLGLPMRQSPTLLGDMGPQGTPGPVAQDGSAVDHADRVASAGRLLRVAGWTNTAMRLESGEIEPDEALETVRGWFLSEKPDADDMAALAALEALAGETPAHAEPEQPVKATHNAEQGALAEVPGGGALVPLATFTGPTAEQQARDFIAALPPQGPRIELRDGVEWFAGPWPSERCSGRGPGRCLCIVHFEGQHLALGPVYDGASRIYERWPIAAASPETPDPRWEPGAVWEHNGERRTLMESQRQHDPPRAYFRELGWLEGHRRADLTEVNGWRYVGE
jgi:hypothetical protein